MKGEKNMGRRRALQVAAAGMGLGLVGTAQGSRATRKSNAVDVMLNWNANSTQAGYFVAKRKGFYDEQGVTVTEFVPGQGGTFAAKQVGLGRQGFGLSDAASVLTARSKGLPVRSYGTSQQRSDGVVYTVEKVFGRKLEKPKQLQGKTLAAPKDSPMTTLTKAVLKRAGVLDSVNFLGVAPEQQTPMLLSGNADAAIAIFDSPTALRRKGYDASAIRLADYMPTVGRTVISRPKFAERNPKTVRGFLRATAKGWAWAANNPKRAMDVMVDAKPSLAQSRKMGVFKIKYTTNNLVTGDNGRWGWQRPKSWNTVSKALFRTGVVPKTDVRAAWTNDYLDTEYEYIESYEGQVESGR
ncbi:ABC transporter substrate-binding protein [Haladaptatus sp. AB643]|uniref:ABC transporter substrate-binding protein n=2 Tax=unclassified Haladaptatus TaxID=2622732 RepID=UPI00209C47D1|nr:ABC transporter substrate-binding protein [Haladaptatus sp. AB618]MCO8244233.1 ABC transporter substrate-binding protein [Haladaptatus sp. AB643]MCO8256037.1 ABC transporter substrate-binding protein [Haladaptatus sp. AB618]